MAAEQGDRAFRFVGTLALWRNIVVGVLASIACIVGAVALARYHSDWTSGDFKVTHRACRPPEAHTSCSGGGSSCTTHRVATCSSLRVDGFSQAFAASFVEPELPPEVGASVRVFYDPGDRSKAFLAHNDFVDAHKTWLTAGLTVACLASAAGAGFTYYMRNSVWAQRVAAGSAVFSMTTGNGL